MATLTQSQLFGILSYDADTGVFTWLVDSGARKCAGSVAGTATSRGVVYISIKRKKYLAHRLAWLYSYGHWPNGTVDHIDGDPSNNRLANLREATAAQQQHNLRRPKGDNPYIGVHFNKEHGRFAARINGKHLGYYSTADDARTAYLAAKKLLHTHHPKS